MEGVRKSAEAYRATALLCRQQAACDPDNSWRLLGEAERWEYLAEQILASRQKDRKAASADYAAEPDRAPDVPSQRSNANAPPRSRTSPSKPSHHG